MKRCFARAVSSGGTLSGDIRFLESLRSRVLGNARSVAVYLPPGYASSRKRYPVLYAQDGQNLFDARTSFIGVEWGVDEACEELIRDGRMEPAIVVGVYNTGRRVYEYTPALERGAGGGGDLYGRFLTDELKPLVDSSFRTRPGPADTAIMGSSLGGLIALYLGWTRPRVFGRVGAVSPHLRWAKKDILRRLACGPTPSPRPRIWADMGGREGEARDWEENVSDLRRLEALLWERGFTPGHGAEVRLYPEAGHDETWWSRRVADVLGFLFPPRRP